MLKHVCLSFAQKVVCNHSLFNLFQISLLLNLFEPLDPLERGFQILLIKLSLPNYFDLLLVSPVISILNQPLYGQLEFGRVQITLFEHEDTHGIPPLPLDPDLVSYEPHRPYLSFDVLGPELECFKIHYHFFFSLLLSHHAMISMVQKHLEALF